MATPNRRLKLGIVGIGVGASEILPAMEQIPEFELGCRRGREPARAGNLPPALRRQDLRQRRKTLRRSECRSGLGFDAESLPRAAHDHRRQRRQACRRRKTDGDLARRSRADDRGVDQEQDQTSVRPHPELRPAYPHHAQDHPLRRAGPALRAPCVGLHRLDAAAAHGGRTGHQPRRRRALSPGAASDRHAAPARRRLGAQRARRPPAAGSRAGRSPATIRDSWNSKTARRRP